MKPVIWLGLASLLLAGCAATPSVLTPRDAVRDFALEARFALKVSLPDQTGQSSGGRLSWAHQGDTDRILVANPLGYGLAEIISTPAQATLRTADGKTRESSDPDALMEEVTGQRLPVTRLPAWLLGRASDAAQVRTDPHGRPERLREAGWQINYRYDNDGADALPSLINLQRGSEIELRLRIEEWKETP